MLLQPGSEKTWLALPLTHSATAMALPCISGSSMLQHWRSHLQLSVHSAVFTHEEGRSARTGARLLRSHTLCCTALTAAAASSCSTWIRMSWSTQPFQAKTTAPAACPRRRGLIDDAWESFHIERPARAKWPLHGIFWVRNSIMACGILRNWWDANWPDQARFSFDQAAMADGVHAYNRAYGAAVRVAPSSVTWWREDIPKLAKESVPLDLRAPKDPLFRHRCRRDQRDVHGNCAVFNTSTSCLDQLNERRPAWLHPMPGAKVDVFDIAPTRCSATSREGVPASRFMSAAHCCRGERLLPSKYDLNGSQSSKLRHCWRPVPSVRGRRSDDWWTCWPAALPTMMASARERASRRRILDIVMLTTIRHGCSPGQGDCR